MTNFGADVLPRHRANVGFVEGSNNSNPWGPRQGIPNAAYCFSAQSIVNYDAGVRWWPESQCRELGFAYCPSGVNVGQARGVVRFDHASRGDPADLIPADLVFFSWNGSSVADHVEVVIQVYADGTFDTIGYNTGSPNGCHVVRRDRRYLLCRFRMQTAFYDGAAPGAAPAPVAPPAPSGPRTLEQGTKGQDVADWQGALNHFGYGLRVDGDFGALTASATKDFQARHGCTVDGEVGPQTRAAMASALSAAPTAAPTPAAPTPAPTPPPPPAPAPSTPAWPGRVFSYPPGVQGDDVRAWQKRMSERGWKIKVDGDYGPASKAIATAFQREKGLTVDGEVGRQTWAAAWAAPVT